MFREYIEMQLHLTLRHRKTKAENFYDILDVCAADVCAMVTDFGKDGLAKFVDQQVDKIPKSLRNFEIAVWEFI